MAPTLLPGDWALVVTPRRTDRGDVVVVEHPGRPGYEMVKRLTAVPVTCRWPSDRATTSTGSKATSRSLNG